MDSIRAWGRGPWCGQFAAPDGHWRVIKGGTVRGARTGPRGRDIAPPFLDCCMGRATNHWCGFVRRHIRTKPVEQVIEGPRTHRSSAARARAPSTIGPESARTVRGPAWTHLGSPSTAMAGMACRATCGFRRTMAAVAAGGRLVAKGAGTPGPASWAINDRSRDGLFGCIRLALAWRGCWGCGGAYDISMRGLAPGNGVAGRAAA